MGLICVGPLTHRFLFSIMILEFLEICSTLKKHFLFSSNHRVLVIVWGEPEVTHGISTVQGVSTPKPPVVQGSTVIGHYDLLL